MTHSVLLNNAAHADLRIITDRGAAWGDDVMSCVVFPAEFRSVQAHYPIAFQKTVDGTGFQPVALFALQEGQNLFLEAGGWGAHYLPWAMERQPFMIGRSGEELMVLLDMDSPRVSRSRGEPLFLPHGLPSDYLERMTSMLLTIHEGVEASKAFVDSLLAHGLLESFVLDVELADGSQNRLAGLYTIDEDRLGALDGATLARLNEAGQLLPIYMVLASISHFRDLIERQNRRLAGIA